MTDKDTEYRELCEWLRANSAGIYRRSWNAADAIESLQAEIARLRAELPDVRLSERECTTLEHWKDRALFLESRWGACSHHCAVLQGERDAARAENAELRAVIADAESAPTTKQVHDAIVWLRMKKRIGTRLDREQSAVLLRALLSATLPGERSIDEPQLENGNE